MLSRKGMIPKFVQNFDIIVPMMQLFWKCIAELVENVSLVLSKREQWTRIRAMRRFVSLGILLPLLPICFPRQRSEVLLPFKFELYDYLLEI